MLILHHRKDYPYMISLTEEFENTLDNQTTKRLQSLPAARRDWRRNGYVEFPEPQKTIEFIHQALREFDKCRSTVQHINSRYVNEREIVDTLVICAIDLLEEIERVHLGLSSHISTSSYHRYISAADRRVAKLPGTNVSGKNRNQP